ncbi:MULTISPECIES: hypothetical protein [Paraburkholderia]
MAFEDAAFCIVDFFAAILLAATGTLLLTTAFGLAPAVLTALFSK